MKRSTAQTFKRRLFSLSELALPEPPIQVICPSSERLEDIVKRIEIILEEGIRWIQYRGKETPRRLQYRDSLLIRELTRRYNALFIVNDFIDLAIATGADGVHLGQEDIPIEIARKIFPEKIIGISTHSLSEAVDASSRGASYIGYGPIFPTFTKDAGIPKEPQSIKEIKKYVKIPLVAIGGIKPENVLSVFKNGADAVAVSSGIIEGDVRVNVRDFLRAIKEFRNGRTAELEENP